MRETSTRQHQMLLTRVMVCKIILKGHMTFDLLNPKVETVQLSMTVHTCAKFAQNVFSSLQVIVVAK